MARVLDLMHMHAGPEVDGVFQSLPEPGAHLFQLDWLAHEPLGCYLLCVY